MQKLIDFMEHGSNVREQPICNNRKLQEAVKKLIQRQTIYGQIRTRKNPLLEEKVNSSPLVKNHAKKRDNEESSEETDDCSKTARTRVDPTTGMKVGDEEDVSPE